MAYWIQNYVLALALSVLITGLIIPKILLIAFRKKLFDTVDERKIHRGIVPRLGGVAFLPALIFSFCLVAGFNLHFHYAEIIPLTGVVTVPLFFLVCGAMLIYLVGMADDLIGVRYRGKFLLQIIAAILIMASGMWVSDLYGFLWLRSIPAWVGWIITGFCIIYVVNAVNLIDGIDGLASGLSAVALGWYSYVFCVYEEYAWMVLSGATLGTLIPFFYYNVFGNPEKQKKIFMGDTGALTTGMVLVFCAIAVMCAKPDFLTVDYNPAIVALSPLIVPCFDVFRVYFHRVKKGRNPFLPDKCHIHHKILALGMNQAAALLTILGVSIAFIGINVLVSPFTNPTIIFIGDVVVWTIANILLTRAIRQREKRLDKTLYD